MTGFMNLPLLHFLQTHLIIGCYTKKTKQSPSNLPPSILHSLTSILQSFRQLQRVLPCKAANDLLACPLIIAGFIPPACLLVSNCLFYTQNGFACSWACWQQGREETLDFLARPTALMKINRFFIKHYMSTLNCNMWRHRCAACMKQEEYSICILLILLCSSLKSLWATIFN